MAAVVVKPEDLKLLMDEMELPEEKAERVLREHKGDIKAAIKYLLTA